MKSGANAGFELKIFGGFDSNYTERNRIKNTNTFSENHCFVKFGTFIKFCVLV